MAALRAEPEPEDLGLSVVVDAEESADRAFSPVDEQLEVKFRSLAENMDAMYSNARSPLRMKASPKESSGRKKLRAARRVRSPQVSLSLKPGTSKLTTVGTVGECC